MQGQTFSWPGRRLHLTLRDLGRGVRWDQDGSEGDGPAGIAGGVLFAGRGEGLCELMDLVLDKLSGEDETYGRRKWRWMDGARGKQTWLGEGVWRVAVLHDKGERGRKY